MASWRPLGEHRYAWDKSGRLTGHEAWSKTRKERETRYRYTINEQIAESRINGILSQHDYRNECVTQVGDSRYEYDICGRVIRRTEQKRGFRPQEWRYRWDDFDRLREVRTPDGEVWQYGYDAFGRRTVKRNIIRAAWKLHQHGISEVQYQWQGMALSASEKRYADGSPARREQWHYREDFELLAKEARAGNDERSHFYPILGGPDGAPQEMYSANGRKVWTRQRSLWGVAAANDASGNGREGCDAGFMGQWEDEESGLWYNLHRYYDAGTGRYLSADPIGLIGGLNLYSYVPNPLSWIDPLGLCKTGPNENTGQGYHNETYAPKPVKPKDAVDRWDEFLGPSPHTNIHPRTGLPDPDRIVSADGMRSIRYDNHEMNSGPTKHHYHEETWTYDPVNNVMNVDNSVVRVPFLK